MKVPDSKSDVLSFISQSLKVEGKSWLLQVVLLNPY